MADTPITPQDFDRLLAWLDPDRARAGLRYEKIRRKLILLFASRRGSHPEEMTDESINRVIRKLPEIESGYEGLPENYFVGVARKVLQEWPRRNRPIEIPPPPEHSAEEEQYLDCLDECLGQLGDTSREMVLVYYHDEKREKIDKRTALAARLGIGMNALRIRAFRTRKSLEQCVRQCVGSREIAWSAQ